MSEMIPWIAAEAERPEGGGLPVGRRRRREFEFGQDGPPAEGLRAHQFPADRECLGEENNLQSGLPEETENFEQANEENQSWQEARQAELDDRREQERVRRIYRGRTVAMLRRYFRYSMECGRLPSILGSEFFRSKVTSYTVVTFEDRAIFVHDMETCLEKLDEFSRQLIGRHILQEHDRWATAKLMHCNEKTIRRYTPVVLDLLSEILLDVGLMERVVSIRENSCQGGHSRESSVSDCDDGKYKF